MCKQGLFPSDEKPQGRRVGLAELPANLPLLLDTAQAAAITSMSETAIRRQCVLGTIKAAQMGNKWRINRDALLEQFGLAEVG